MLFVQIPVLKNADRRGFRGGAGRAAAPFLLEYCKKMTESRTEKSNSGPPFLKFLDPPLAEMLIKS